MALRVALLALAVLAVGCRASDDPTEKMPGVHDLGAFARFPPDRPPFDSQAAEMDGRSDLTRGPKGGQALRVALAPWTAGASLRRPRRAGRPPGLRILRLRQLAACATQSQAVERSGQSQPTCLLAGFKPPTRRAGHV